MYEIKEGISKSNEKILMINGYQLHSKYDPRKEAEKFFEKEFKQNYLHILFGYGAGYIAQEFKKRIQKEDLIVIEPIKELVCDTADEVIFSEDIDEIKSRLHVGLKDKYKEIKVICSPNYDKFAAEEYKIILDLIKKTQKFNILGVNTIKFFSYDWQENYIKNMVLAATDTSLSKFEKKYNCPVIIASSGPSLDKQIAKLKDIKDHVLILCAGSTINTLLNAGIDPDVILTVDGSLANYNHFKNINSKATLLYALTSKFDIQKEYKGNRVSCLINRDENFKKFIKEQLNKDLPIILGGSSVAHYALSVAKYITTGPIAVIGQDLAYTNNVSHSQGNKHFKSVGEINKGDLIDIDGYYGDKVKSNYGFLAMKEDFESLMALIGKDLVVYNCTEGGANINSFTNMPFNKFIDSFVDFNSINRLEVGNSRNEIPLQNLLTSYREFIRKLASLETQLHVALNVLKIVKKRGLFGKNDYKVLDATDLLIKTTCEKVLLTHITQALTSNILMNFKESENETDIMKFNRIVDQHNELYKGMLDVVSFSTKYLNEAIILIEKDLNE